MTSTAIILRAGALALGAFVSLHQPAQASLIPTLETATAGSASWTYTIGGPGHAFNFGPTQGTDWLGGSPGSGGSATVAPPGSTPSSSSADGSTTGGLPTGGSTSNVPEPGTLALVGFPLLFIVTMVRRRR